MHQWFFRRLIMVIVLPGQRKASKWGAIGGAFGKGLGEGMESAQEKKEMEKYQEQENEAANKLGIDLRGIRDPQTRREILLNGIKSKTKYQNDSSSLLSNRNILSDLENRRELPQGSLNAYENDPKMAEQVSRPKTEPKTPKQALGEKEVPPEIAKKIKKVLADNPKANADELRLAMDESSIPPSYSNPYTENRRRTEEQVAKSREDQTRALRQETLPIRKQLADKALAASHGIQNKEHLIQLIDKGDLNDPTIAALAESLPLNLGKRLLSKDTTEYKAGLVEEFGDLRNIFQGQTRIKEIELLENKIADIYLTDEQKKAVLRSRINALKADMIRAESAEELENRHDLGVLQFNSELEKRAKPKLDALFNQILDEQKSIIQNAENRRNLPLDPNDPEDRKIMEQIKKEAGGDKTKAKAIAKKKGYTVKGSP